MAGLALSRFVEQALARAIQGTGDFRGKWQLIRFWIKIADASQPRTRGLPYGGRIRCDVSIPYEAMVWLGQEEPRELENLGRLLRPGQVFLDCGANIGLWTIVSASLVGDRGQVYALEPNPMTFQKLTRNIEAGAWGNVRPVHAAAGREAGELLLLCEEEHNRSRVVPEARPGAIPVPVVTIDSWLKGERVDGGKIDVEGAELEVLLGAKQTLADWHPWLCLEFNPGILGPIPLKDWPVHRFLREMGYEAQLFHDALGSDQAPLPEHWRSRHYCNLYYSARIG